MIDLQSKSQNISDFLQKISNTFNQSLTGEQRFLKDVLNGNIKLIPYEEVMAKLKFVLKNGLQRDIVIITDFLPKGSNVH
ncbi:hypothetical protein [Bibersteinia trehalosi]|nr:hypothetical protein [Bibersteinia trehalosi]